MTAKIRRSLTDTARSKIFSDVQVLKWLPQGTNANPNPVQSLSADTYAEVPVREAYASLFRHFVRLKQLVSSRRDIRELYVEYVKLRFTEDYSLRRLLVLSDSRLPSLSHSQLLERTTSTLKFVVNAWTVDERTLESKILLNLLEYQYHDVTSRNYDCANVHAGKTFRKSRNVEEQLLRIDLEARRVSAAEVKAALERNRKYLPASYYGWMMEADELMNRIRQKEKVPQEKLHSIGKLEFERSVVMLNETTRLVL